MVRSEWSSGMSEEAWSTEIESSTAPSEADAINRPDTTARRRWVIAAAIPLVIVGVIGMAFLAHGWAAREGDEGSDEGMPTLAVEAEGKEAIHGAPVMETTKRTTETAVDVTEEPTLQPTTMTPNATSLPTSLPTKDTIVTNATTTTTSKPISFCNVTLEGATNSFKSQNYPQDYPNNLTQTWCIDTLDDCPLSMTFRDIEVQQDNNCTLDNITVYDGPTASSRELASICANSTITSTSNKVYVVFRTDADTVKHGFDALYEAAKCHFHNLIVTKAPGILELNTTRVTSQWLLAAEAGRVQLTFELFELDDCCNCDYLEVYDGSDTSSGLMGKFCGIMLSLNLTSSSRFMFLSYNFDITRQGRGIRVQYSAVE